MVAVSERGGGWCEGVLVDDVLFVACVCGSEGGVGGQRECVI